MVFTAAEISALLHGEYEGNPRATVNNIAPIESAKKGDLSFISNPKYEKYLAKTKASVVLLGFGIDAQGCQATIIRLKDVYSSFSVLLKQVEQMQIISKTGIESPAFIDPTASIGQNVYIGAFSYIGQSVVVADNAKIYPNTYIGDGSKIGQNTVLYAGVKCYANTQIGANVVIHAGAVIGSDGFGFAPQADGGFLKMPQTGNVIIEDGVEIGANTTIDRATIKSTIIKQGAKLDNLIQIGHNVIIGKNTAIASQTGISGSSKIGDNCLIGGQVGVVGHIEIAEQSKIGAKAGVGKSIIEKGKAWSGRPITEHLQNLKIQAITKKLPSMFAQLQALEKKVNKIIVKGESTHE